jgi:hypothetical protein
LDERGAGRFGTVLCRRSGREILVFKKDSDGGDAKEFLNIENRNPYFENEDGLMSIAFHPGFKTNGLFYIYSRIISLFLFGQPPQYLPPI